MPDAEIPVEVEVCPEPVASHRVAGMVGGLLGLLTAGLVLCWAPALREGMLSVFAPAHAPTLLAEDPAEAQVRLAHRVDRLQAELDAMTPARPYLIVSTADNRFRLMQKDRVLREGLCSTGSYIRLEADGQQQWTFQTPRGAFHILKKTENPVWNKPDWAFIEEGRPVPPPGSPERFERGVLGDYSLALGDGYLIHGTLYQRLLGLPVTHGCVRLGDDDLEAVYSALRVGASVYIY